ncbi:unnamed protein product [Peniophora sp. CBMAI 1063]|nr:unnamed protein product [Peniophora sp. CBMAI 1063]
MFNRYSALVDENSIPFVRAAGDQRIVDSSTNWTAGFGDASGANLSDSDTLNLMGMCPFDTLSTGVDSPFCDLFTAEEYASYEYYYDIDKYYGTGPGNTLDPVQGVGYVNDLLARLTGRAVQDETQTNRTLDSDLATFPLSRTFYADFLHDNTMAPIFAAHGLVNSTALDPFSPGANRLWVNSKLVPFSGHMTVEKLDCSGKESVRVLMNDAVQPLQFCGAVDGMCEFQAFVESQLYARENGQGDFELCGFVPS